MIKKYSIPHALRSLIAILSLSFPLGAISKNALSLLTDTVTVKINQAETLPPDISFLFADLKYHKGKLKICEFGGQTAGIADTCVIVNGKKEILATPYWELFWHYLTQFNLPIWYVGAQDEAIITELKAIGGSSFSSLKKFSNFLKKLNSSNSKPRTIRSHKGILVLRRPIGDARQKLIEKYPDLLIVNHTTRRFTGKKNAYNLFHRNQEIMDYMPRFKAYKKEYSPMLASQIFKDIPADFYIIKPINAMQSNGVIMTTKDDLEKFLTLILQDTNNIKSTDHKSLSYWKTDQNKTFFVEEYAPSRLITKRGKEYDPTMRMVFFLSQEEGTITVNVIAGYWKIPIKALDDVGTLTEKHITKPFSGHFFTGIAINPKDMRKVKMLLKEMLPKIYTTMLAAHRTRS